MNELQRTEEEKVSIAVCDDEVELARDIASRIGMEMEDLARPCRVEVFGCGEELLEASAVKPFDLVFLDIEMPGMDGKETARRLLRLSAQEVETQMVFVTSHGEEMENAFDYNAAGFLSKLSYGEKLNKTLSRLLDNRERRRGKGYLFAVKGQSGQSVQLTVRERDIVYFECVLKKIYLSTIHERVCLIGRNLRQIQEEFSAAPFAVPHNNYVVNMEQVEWIGKNELLLKSGEAVPLSRYRKKEFVEAYAGYILEGGR